MMVAPPGRPCSSGGGGVGPDARGPSRLVPAGFAASAVAAPGGGWLLQRAATAGRSSSTCITRRSRVLVSGLWSIVESGSTPGPLADRSAASGRGTRWEGSWAGLVAAPHRGRAAGGGDAADCWRLLTLARRRSRRGRRGTRRRRRWMGRPCRPDRRRARLPPTPRRARAAHDPGGGDAGLRVQARVTDALGGARRCSGSSRGITQAWASLAFRDADAGGPTRPAAPGAGPHRGHAADGRRDRERRRAGGGGARRSGGARARRALMRASFFRTGYEMLFAPLLPAEKRATKAVLDVGVTRVGDVLGAGRHPPRPAGARGAAGAPGAGGTRDRRRGDPGVPAASAGMRTPSPAASPPGPRAACPRSRRMLSRRHADTVGAGSFTWTCPRSRRRRRARPRRAGATGPGDSGAPPDPAAAALAGSPAGPRVPRFRDAERRPGAGRRPLLAWDAVARSAIAALRHAGPAATGALVRALLDRTGVHGAAAGSRSCCRVTCRSAVDGPSPAWRTSARGAAPVRARAAPDQGGDAGGRVERERILGAALRR